MANGGHVGEPNRATGGLRKVATFQADVARAAVDIRPRATQACEPTPVEVHRLTGTGY
ncbi:MAG: hypothetical protein H5T86_12335 [Armatimonadetes bacterium]|nr:hypothetical protein [Armatimonadota bacterium]